MIEQQEKLESLLAACGYVAAVAGRPAVSRRRAGKLAMTTLGAR
jgi:hypothetical protein